MKVFRKIIEINDELCDGCGQCVPDCAEGALKIVDGKARMIADKYCDGLGACLGSCPTGALRVIERQADDFDEAAVEILLRSRKEAEPAVPAKDSTPCGCPSAGMQSFQPLTPCQAANKPIGLLNQAGASALSHWPIKIRLVPPTAPFLKNADLLIAADCTPIAYPAFQRDFLQGRVVMAGCPKFDDVAGYIDKIAEIFKTARPRSVMIVIMEVPCCAGLRMIVKEARQRSGLEIEVEEAVVSVRGDLLRREKW